MRKTINYTVVDDNRDKHKTFVITEMSAAQAESWAIRALLALTSNGAEIPDNISHLGMAALAEVGIRGLSSLRWEIAEPLLDEMMSCVKIMPDPHKPHVVRPIIDEDIEEVMTRVKLKGEVWKLHVNFFNIGDLLNSAGTPKETLAGNSPNT